MPHSRVVEYQSVAVFAPAFLPSSFLAANHRSIRILDDQRWLLHVRILDGRIRIDDLLVDVDDLLVTIERLNICVRFSVCVRIDDLLVTAEGVRDSAGQQDDKGFHSVDEDIDTRLMLILIECVDHLAADRLLRRVLLQEG